MECEDIPDKAANLPGIWIRTTLLVGFVKYTNAYYVFCCILGPSDKAATNNSRVAAESKTEEDSDDEGDPKVACCCGCNEVA